MKRHTLLLILAAMVGASAYGQTAEEVLQSIVQNNLTLKAVHEGAKADKLDNTTGITLRDPEVDFAYKWGAPSDVMNKVDLSVMQGFDYATVFGLKRKLARSRNELVDIESQEQELMVVQEAKELMVNIVHANKIKRQYDERIAQLQRLVGKYQQALKVGESNKIELNKAKLALAEAEAEASTQEVEREALCLALKAMNGGKNIAFNDTVYPSFAATQNEAMTTGNILNAKNIVQQGIAQKEISKAKAEALPELSVGYVSELTKAEKLRGIGIGVSIPLWSNRNNVRRAKAQQMAQASAHEDAIHQLNAKKEEQAARAASLQKASQSAYRMLRESNSQELLLRALQMGEISLVDYLLNMQDYYALTMKAMETERDYQLALVRLAAM